MFRARLEVADAAGLPGSGVPPSALTLEYKEGARAGRAKLPVMLPSSIESATRLPSQRSMARVLLL